jgi:hypothetical protein
MGDMVALFNRINLEEESSRLMALDFYLGRR